MKLMIKNKYYKSEYLEDGIISFNESKLFKFISFVNKISLIMPSPNS